MAKGKTHAIPIKTLSEPTYKEWRERYPRSMIRSWDTQLSRNYNGGVVVVSLACRCHSDGRVGVEVEEGVGCIAMDQKK